MSTDKKFQWTDELVKEFVSRDPSIHRCEQDMADFKASKEVTDTPVQQERIEVKLVCRNSELSLNNPNNVYSIYIPKKFKTIQHDHTFAKLKQAIEAILNNDTDTNQPNFKDAYEKLRDLHQRLYNDYADLINNSMGKIYSQSEVDTIRTNIWWAARVKNEGNYRFTFLEDYLREQELRIKSPHLFMGAPTTTPTSNADTKGEAVTDNGNVACFSVNDLLEIDHSGNGKILTITYEKLMGKLKQKLNH
jgi:hypothetical protein